MDVVDDSLLKKKISAVNSQGGLNQDLIEGVQFRPTRPVHHEDGSLTEIARAAWPELETPIVQVHVNSTLPGRTRAWGMHMITTDRLFVVNGLVSIVVYDDRDNSPTKGMVNEFKVSERCPGLLIIPPKLYHGWKVIGTEEAFILNMPSKLYDYSDSDGFNLAYHSDEAVKKVPWRW